MQKPVRYRFVYLICMVAVYFCGYKLLPESISYSADKWLTTVFAALYFVALPALYFYCMIVVGKQKLWKMLISFSLSALVARYTFPSEIAAYFEFIAWIRYPLAAVLIMLELAIVYMVVKSLWKARHLPGDPRLHAQNQFPDDDRKRTAALLWSHEPASWYYAIPRFSRNHVPVIGKLVTRLSNPVLGMMAILSVPASAVIAYWLLESWSLTAAIIVSSLIMWGTVSAVAAVRLRRHFSIYIQGDDLVINPGFYRTLFGKVSALESVEAGRWNKSDIGESLQLGRGDTANARIRFSEPAVQYSMMASIEDKQKEVYLVCENPEEVVQALQPPQVLQTAS